jgi:predicted DNA-binding transcriptional regulator YafY
MTRRLDSRLRRIEAIERRLAQRPKGATAGELAREFLVSKPTILRDLAYLEEMGAKLDRKGHRYILDTRRLLHSVKLSLHELLAIYLAVRLLSRHSDEHNPHIITALEKLALVLQERSPFIAHHIEQAADAVRFRKTREEYVQVLEILTNAWAEGKKVRLRYHSAEGEQTERLFAPLFIEPSGIGYACYVIGYDYLREAIRTFKVERIHEAFSTDELRVLEPEFDLQKLHTWLASAWGVIWRDEGEFEVMLRFVPSVVRRVKESTWHHTQEITDLPDGSCLYKVRIGSLKEILPWVRGWGASVEVLEPTTFRQQVIEEVRQLTQIYEREPHPGCEKDR